MNKPLLVSLLIVFSSLAFSVVLYFLIVSFVKLYDLTVESPPFTIQGSEILQLVSGIDVLVMFMLVFLFLLLAVLEFGLKRDL
jgi:hypothetical protein